MIEVWKQELGLIKATCVSLTIALNTGGPETQTVFVRAVALLILRLNKVKVHQRRLFEVHVRIESRKKFWWPAGSTSVKA